MRLHIADDTGEVLFCPECERELWPAYWGDDGLEIAFWGGFEPPDGQAGLLLCANLDCTYEEPITFADSPADAVLWNFEFTWLEYRSESWWQWPESWRLEQIEEVERLLARTGQAKVQATLELYRQELGEHRQAIERWLAEAAKGYPVKFHAEEEELTGRILGSRPEAFSLQTPEGEVRVVPKNLVWRLRIEYPRKPRKARKRPVEDKWVGFPIGDDRYIVVEGYHLRYGGGSELGDRYKGRCWDPEVAATLRLREVVPGYWEGAFTEQEIERFYHRHDYVRIRGHWVEEMSRIEDPPLVWARTKDPVIAEALEMGPQYSLEGGEFGSWDGEIFAYDENFSLDEIEAERWEEEPLTLPPEDWPC